MLVQGSAVSNRTEFLINKYIELLQNGVEAEKILVLTSNSFKKSKFVEAVKSSCVKHFENPRIHTFFGLAYNAVIDNWPVLENKINTGNPVITPNLTGLEISQYFFKKAIKDVGFKDYNSKINLIHQLFRRYSLIVNNALSDKEVNHRSFILGEAFANDAASGIELYKKNTLEYRAFDYIRQLSLFEYIYKNTGYFKNVDYLIADDSDEMTPLEIDFLEWLKPSLTDFFVGYDRYGSSRIGFLNTDTETVSRIEGIFSSSVLNLDDIKEYSPVVKYSSFTRRLEMLFSAFEKICALIKSGVKPSEIAIVTPCIDESLKFAAEELFGSKNIGYQFFSGSQKLCETPVVKNAITLLKLVFGENPDVYTFRSLLNKMLKIPVRYCLPLVEKYQNNGCISSECNLGVEVYDEAVKKFLNVIEKIKADGLALSDRLYLIYENIVDLKAFSDGQIDSFNFFLKQVQDFESVFEKLKTDRNFQKSVLVQLENSIISENPSSAPEVKENCIVFATCQKLIDFSLKTKYQFWLDVTSSEWVKEDYGTLYNAWAFQRSWKKDAFTYEDNLFLSALKTKKQLRKLSLLCCETIYAYDSLFDIEGNENFGGIADFLQTGTAQTENKIEFNFTPREDQKPVLDYKSGNMAVSAVPGAGKTTILLALIIKLLQRGVKSENIFVLTYMDSAARNFKERIKQACPSLEKLPNISTIHGLALRILKENSNYVKAGLEADFEVCDDNLRQKIIREVMAQNFIEQDEFDKYEKALSSFKLSYVSKIPYVKDKELQKFLKLYFSYNVYLKNRNLIDYDDMLCLCVKLLEENKDIASFYQNLCEYVIEDEAQDSSVIQQKLLEILSAKHKNLIRCGDINQAITTTFTNADIDGFRNYVLHSQNVTMDYSQRCSKNVYELANSLVDYAKESPVLKDAFFDIKMRAVDGKNPVVDNGVESDLFEDYKEERAYLLETIRNIFRHEKNASVAILVRNNYQIEDYSSFLADYGYEVITKSDCLIMQPVFALIFALLKFCAHPWQNENVLNLALVLKEQKLVNFTQNDIDYLKELKSPFILQQEDCLPDGALSGFLWDLNYWLESSDLSVDEQALKAGMYYYTSEIEKSNIFIIALLLKRFYSQYKNMDLFLERLQELALRPVLNKFKFFAEETMSSSQTQKKAVIQVMTYHKSKGDEFDYVFIPQLSEEFLPVDIKNIKIKSKERFIEAVKAINCKYSKKDEHSLCLMTAHENLRLFYVAVTRAKKKLFISCAKKYKKFSKLKTTEPSKLFDYLLSTGESVADNGTK